MPWIFMEINFIIFVREYKRLDLIQSSLNFQDLTQKIGGNIKLFFNLNIMYFIYVGQQPVSE